MMFALQQAPAPTGGFVVKIIQPPSDVEGLADVLIGSLGLIGVLVLEIGHERAHFEAAFPHLEAVWLPTSAGDDQVLLLTAEALQGRARP